MNQYYKPLGTPIQKPYKCIYNKQIERTRFYIHHFYSVKTCNINYRITILTSTPHKCRHKTVPAWAVETITVPSPPQNSVLAPNLQTELKEGFYTTGQGQAAAVIIHQIIEHFNITSYCSTIRRNATEGFIYIYTFSELRVFCASCCVFVL